ncbi:transcriptional regulator, TetR family [Oscillibacter sp. PC13]|uniref:TetR/AcrR family transcriptional regulator n=1 Tax=Oscillibacter sp. PC13 TaxID=1855299 RepID=UPI0008EADB5A|nr:TetR/AcrR family transcriptional regulator [Oscillibacter sp. PC13]SFP83822.1 transcriptional regulator, TetR family [Oscillibacter sp. PC13]
MKREEKNQQMRRRILDSALEEFAKQGYGASSINVICNSPDISKGIVYHYYETKDGLYLSCVGECLEQLTAYLQTHVQLDGVSVEEGLGHYFNARSRFFQEHPLYQRLFCEAVITPPAHLKSAIQKLKAPFDTLNVEILQELLRPVSLRPHISREDVIETFRQFQDFINASEPPSGRSFDAREYCCHRALDILLYGVIAREET